MTNKEFIELVKKVFKDCRFRIDSTISTINVFGPGNIEVEFYKYSKLDDHLDASNFYFGYKLDGDNRKYSLGNEDLELKVYMIYDLIFLPLVEVDKKVKKAFSSIIKMDMRDKEILREIKLKYYEQ